jgi:serine/threonine protein kinase
VRVRYNNSMSVERIGRYQIEETLGRGAVGVVYRARDPIIDRQVALKTLRVDLDAEHAEEFRARFVREAQAAGRLNHPGIVTVHDVGEDPETGLVYIAMEYVEGQDLKQVLASGRRFRPSEAARIAADVATALDYAHSLGVVHRDIKPANIILTPDGTPKITDFGIARLETSNLTVDGQFIGTPNFMSPEQITGKAVDGRSDLFSLGVVLFNLLTEKRPFNGGTMHEVTLRIVQEPCPIPSTLSDHIPPAFNPVILKCLEKNPDRRFQTGAEVARVLAALARSLVDREPTDDLSTGVFQPDLATRIHAGDDRPLPPPPTNRVSRIQRWIRERLPGTPALRVPEWMRWDLEPRWVVAIIAATVVMALIPIFVLRARIDRGPFAGPTPGATKNLHGVVASLHAAETRLRMGDLAAAESAVLAALDQAPASPAARRLAAEIRQGLEEQRTSAENQQRVSRLVSDGRSAYRRGDYAAAGELFRQALDLDPRNEIAASFLELTEERSKSLASSRTAALSPATGLHAAPAQPPPRVPAKSGVSRITVTFDSPISEGSIAVTLDGESLADVPFDFSREAFLGFKKKGRGTVRRVILTPSGSHTIGVELRESKRGVLGSAEFVRDLEPDSAWTLRVDLPGEKAQPNFFFVKPAR